MTLRKQIVTTVGLTLVCGVVILYGAIRGLILHSFSNLEESLLRTDMDRARAAPLEPLFEAGHVHLMAGAWNDALLAQFREFPHGAHDDIVDAVAGAYARLLRPGVQGISRHTLGF